MWLPKTAFDLFRISHDTTVSLREELTAIKVERDSLQKQLSASQVVGDWLRMQINTLQNERTALLEKVYGIKVPTPQIERTPVMGQDTKQDEFSFDDMGETLAKKFGLPLYDKQ